MEVPLEKLCGHLNNNTGYASNWMTSFSELAFHSFCLDHDKSTLTWLLNSYFSSLTIYLKQRSRCDYWVHTPWYKGNICF